MVNIYQKFMKIITTKFKDLFIIKHNKFKDNRGFFSESFKKDVICDKLGYNINFIQENIVYSKANVLRGLHFQEEPFSQSKLITVLKGVIFDVVVDLRKNSETYSKAFTITISEDSAFSLFIPKGFAHGYLTKSTEALVSYKVDNKYRKESERGIRYDNHNLKIDWGIKSDQIIISEKDKKLNFQY